MLLDAGDLDVFGWSSRSNADTENASDFLEWLLRIRSVIGVVDILGGGGESTSNSGDDDRDLDLDRLLEQDLDFVLVTLKFDGESHTNKDLEWYVPLSSSSDSCFSIKRFTPNLISSEIIKQFNNLYEIEN